MTAIILQLDNGSLIIGKTVVLLSSFIPESILLFWPGGRTGKYKRTIVR